MPNQPKKPKTRSPQHVVASLGRRIAELRGSLIKADTRVGELKAELATLEESVEPDVWALACKMAEL